MRQDWESKPSPALPPVKTKNCGVDCYEGSNVSTKDSRPLAAEKVAAYDNQKGKKHG